MTCLLCGLKAIETVWPGNGGMVYQCPEVDPKIHKPHWTLTVDYFNGVRTYRVRKPHEGSLTNE